ncbi:MAG: CRISPR-associated helicase Cas3', partial [Endozoicomonadaceae bacterium]|nr:CRISPR-associated helicase Cas3' [Endozoicomonadaceae bacterium]
MQQMVDNNKLAKAVFAAGCLHDLGKIDPEFQQWLAKLLKKAKGEALPDDGLHIDKGKFSFETHPRHNEISLLLYHLMLDDSYKGINKRNRERVKHSIYWHHAKPIRQSDFKKLDTVYKKFKKNIGKAKFTETIHTVNQLVNAVDDISKRYLSKPPLLISDSFQNNVDEDREYELDERSFPTYKRYSLGNDEVDDYLDNIKDNAKNNLARTALITADRLVSALTDDALSTHIKEKTLETLITEHTNKDSDLSKHIQSCLRGFKQRYPDSTRNPAQAKAAEQLSDVESVGVLKGPAGCGKTKIALEWAAKTQAKQIIWICPRVQVCQGLLNDLTRSDYLPNATIEINTGAFKWMVQNGEKRETTEDDAFSGDIVITTIDQITNAIVTHNKVTSLVTYMNAHVVFDEYHEYINMSAFNLLFAELVECKKLQEDNANALLVSATPNYYFVEEFLGIDPDDIIGIDSFNNRHYKIEFTEFDESKEDDSNPLYQQQPANTFVISNTAITAQKSFIDHQSRENGLLFHSKFKKEDKDQLFQKVFDNFKQDGSQVHDVLRSGPVVQASLNISCDRMITEFTHAENWLQRLGRLDRFGLNDKENVYVIAIPETLAKGKQSGKCARFLNSLNTLQSAKAWYEFLQDKLTEKTITLTEIYQLYKEFYDNSTYRKAVEDDLKRALKKSAQVIDLKLIDPVSFPRKKRPKSDKVKIKKHSLRGDNRFVQMAVCNISDRTTITYSEKYAYSDSDLEANLTTSVELICGYGDSNQDLLAFMVKKHHNIKDTKKPYKN